MSDLVLAKTHNTRSPEMKVFEKKKKIIFNKVFNKMSFEFEKIQELFLHWL